MKLNVIGGVIAVLAFAALIVGYSSLFTVYQTQQALVIRLRLCTSINASSI
jgi:membrane protease subunit HflC